jgi:uncharacterized protein YecE (DUF72 family)
MPVLVGTSGWQYRDWRGRFYPPKLPQRLWLEHHAAAFGTTEVNNSFYRLPAREVFEQWRARTPEDYVVTVKASRFLTHIKRLKEPEEPVARLMDRVAALGDRLGAVLVQLPPNLQADVDKLDACLACFPAGTRLAVEPRHDSWWNPDLRDVLTAHRAALVWSDRDSRPIAPLWRTTDWAYLRLHHGGGEAYWPYERASCATGSPGSARRGTTTRTSTSTRTTTPAERRCATRSSSLGSSRKRAGPPRECLTWSRSRASSTSRRPDAGPCPVPDTSRRHGRERP